MWWQPPHVYSLGDYRGRRDDYRHDQPRASRVHSVHFITGESLLVPTQETRDSDHVAMGVQDTVVALEALAVYSARVFSKDAAVEVTASTPAGDWSHTFTLNAANFGVLQTAQVL